MNGTLPRLLVLTDRLAVCRRGRTLVDVVASVCAAGAGCVVFREKDLPAAERAVLADAVAGAVRAHEARLVVASDWRLADRLGAWGVHLAADDPVPPVGTGLLAGRSCHHRDDIVRAARAGLAWVTVSPVHPSASKPGYGPALGTDGLRGLVRQPGCPPAYALGGVEPAGVARLLAAGAHGVAVMGGIMASDDPSRSTADLLEALPE